MSFVDVLKWLFGGAGVLGLIGLGLFGASKFRNSKLKKGFEKIADGFMNDKDKVHDLQIDMAKNQQKKDDLQDKIKVIDKQVEEVDSKKSKEPENKDIIDLFDKLSKN
jgi:predicted  nucleic acid-binding Zn-ribbon protein